MSDYNEVNDIRFNQDKDCFIVSLNEGIRIYNLDPLYELFYLDSTICGSIAFSEMIYRTNIIAMVGGGQEPMFAENVVVMWDDFRKKFIFEFIINLPVLEIHATRDKLFVVVQNQIQIYQYICDPPTKLFSLDIRDNFTGLSTLYVPPIQPTPSHTSPILLVAFPGIKRGSVQIMDLNSQNLDKRSHTLKAHESQIHCLSFNRTGTLLATASLKGTLVRIHDISGLVKSFGLWETKNAHGRLLSDMMTKSPRKPCSLLYELRRGSDSARIYCVNFSFDSQFVCTASDKGTVHVFSLKPTSSNASPLLPSSPLKSSHSKFRILDPMILTMSDSQTGLTHFPVTPDKLCLCTFSAEDATNIYAISADKTIQKYVFTLDGNNCNRESFDNYLDLAQYPEI
ncbi:WD repeat domain phosphoinositide-interacting protein 4-like isoform X2 [Gordionus sp. m RMFG-2023]|uniref:WD repeat domain phosphoinositide-interacting protein 4-like isoform X2 n=1 Tax=Gordionus sp. m RMFG-2023 TaxID=3053472 RepID=UPI0031FD18B3